MIRPIQKIISMIFVFLARTQGRIHSVEEGKSHQLLENENPSAFQMHGIWPALNSDQQKNAQEPSLSA